jgi:hypothetical protein
MAKKKRKKPSGCQRRRRSLEQLPKMAEIVFMADMGFGDKSSTENQRRAVHPEPPVDNSTSSKSTGEDYIFDNSPY